MVRPSAISRTTARADRRATSRQIGWPEGASAAVRHGEAERFGHDLRGGRRAEKLAAAARRRARAAAELGGLLERELAVRVARADRLHRAGVDAVGRRQRDAARARPRREIARSRERHQHRGQPLVAGADADDPASRRQRADQPPQHDGGIVPVRQAVHHARRPLCAAVAGVGDEAGEGHSPRVAQLSAAASISSPTSQWPVW